MLIGAVTLAGCKGVPTRTEQQAQNTLNKLTQVYQPANNQAGLPVLETNAALGTLLTYAMLNHPRVRAAYYEYAAAVAQITLARSLPDPRLTFELDIKDVVMTLMPGLMVEVPWMKKLRIRAEVATAESQAKYFAFESAVLQTAYELKRAYYQLYFLNERIRLDTESLRLASELEVAARAQTASGQATLHDVLRAQTEQDKLRIELINLNDSRTRALAQFKAALGLQADQPDPPQPQQFEFTPPGVTAEQLFSVALARNPQLKQMEAELRMAEAGIRLAHQSKFPDFNAGIEADLKAAPVMWRPMLGVTLPVWRDKIAAELAAAQARKNAAQARLSAEQIQLAVEFADKSVMFREATRQLMLITDELLPRARQMLEVARAAYGSGKTDFISLLQTERTLLDLQLAEADTRMSRELALAELSLLIAGVTPPGAPVLGADSIADASSASRSFEHVHPGSTEPGRDRTIVTINANRHE